MQLINTNSPTREPVSVDFPLPFEAPFLTQKHKDDLERNGYVVVENIISDQQCANAIEAICDFLQVKQSEPSTWYKAEPLNAIGLVPMHQHPSFWDIRQNPRVYQTFRHLLEEEQLWVTMDRASFRPPCRYDLEAYGEDANPMHWDYDFRQKPNHLYQGLIYLNDTNAKQGAFACVPQVFQQIKQGTFPHMDKLNRFHSKGLFLEEVMDFSSDDIVPIEAPAGSLIIWDARLPHGCVSNHYHKPRFVQFVSMFKAEDPEAIPVEIIQDRAQRIECFMDMRAPECHRDLKGQMDPEPYKRPELTPLGRKLLGVDRW
ncbi:phytanoyl-CoA dioxygenase family protein [Vibrio sp. NTOU-M3]|uniref:phytanoyl-CoA dioxygenase family protein n=1 Tax=Vibrio sp. NTOU-M3 TaxID=3234954 RepID=UPI00349F08AD